MLILLYMHCYQRSWKIFLTWSLQILNNKPSRKANLLLCCRVCAISKYHCAVCFRHPSHLAGGNLKTRKEIARTAHWLLTTLHSAWHVILSPPLPLSQWLSKWAVHQGLWKGARQHMEQCINSNPYPPLLSFGLVTICSWIFNSQPVLQEGIIFYFN